MCIVFFVQNSSKYKLVIAANRDEFLNRPTERANWWMDFPKVLGGIDKGLNLDHKSKYDFCQLPSKNRDNHAYGTWIGINVDGRFSFITNYREHPSFANKNAISRGFLTRDFLTNDDLDPLAFANNIQECNDLYNGYNLVFGMVDGPTYFYGNRGNQSIVKIEDNVVYGLSNGRLNDPWPKSEHGKLLFQNAIEKNTNVDDLIKDLLQILSDSTQFPDELLPPGMYDYDLERMLSPIFISKERTPNRNYGTKTHTIIIVDNNGACTFVETDRHHSEHPFVECVSEASFNFKIKMDIPSISVLNSCDKEKFNTVITILFEPSPLSDLLFQYRPFESYNALMEKTTEIISNLNDQDKIMIVNAHPRIGATKSTLSALSKQEQYSMHVQEEDKVNFELSELNNVYESKHGFKFVTFVNGRSRKDILPELGDRINNLSNDELKTGLDAMIMIAKDRLLKCGIN